VNTVDVIIYHNAACATSRNTLALIRNADIEPHVIEYLTSPPSPVMVKLLAQRTALGIRGLLREKGTPFAELGLGDPELSDVQLLDAIAGHPILLNRPIVVTIIGVRLCRPSEKVLEILPWKQRGEFRKEDGELVVDSTGTPVA
jgi:arsenate reductase